MIIIRSDTFAVVGTQEWERVDWGGRSDAGDDLPGAELSAEAAGSAAKTAPNPSQFDAGIPGKAVSKCSD